MRDQRVNVGTVYAAVVRPASSVAAWRPATSARGPVGRPRSAGSVILLSIVTLGVYGLVWQYQTFKEMKDYSGQGLGGGLALLLAVVLGGIVTVFAMPAEVGNVYATEGADKPVSGATGAWVFLPLIGGVIWLAKTQGALNAYWRSHGAA